MKKWLLLSTALVIFPASTRSLAATKVAVVNVPVVSERYRKTTDLEARFDAIRNRLKQERAAMQDRLDRQRRSLMEELKPGTPEFAERRKSVAMLEAEIQWFVESESAHVERGLAESLRSIYADVHAVVAEIAKEKGYDLVLASDLLPPETPENPNQVKQQILLQKVMYWSPNVDITDEVVNRLNGRYKGLPVEGGGGGDPNRFPPDADGRPAQSDPVHRR